MSLKVSRRTGRRTLSAEEKAKEGVHLKERSGLLVILTSMNKWAMTALLVFLVFGRLQLSPYMMNALFSSWFKYTSSLIVHPRAAAGLSVILPCDGTSAFLLFTEGSGIVLHLLLHIFGGRLRR
mmetsp:Transcript_41103/g.81087  ORF Transcript_41103/g.81087 Transcript_41103/m.81087 type:complete len:124 (+) Transcript_41103:478-849(+)